MRSRAAVVAFVAAIVLGQVFLGQVYGQPPQEVPTLKFDAASIHEWGPGQGPPEPFAAGLQFLPGRVRSQCANLASLVINAYQPGLAPIEGMPEWGRASCGYPDSRNTFVIEATMPASTTLAQSRQMMQALLAERFRFAVHWETRQLPTYTLSTASGKSKLKPSDPADDPPIRPGSVGCPADDPHCHQGFCCGSATLNTLTATLSHVLGRPVIDKTGLTGTYYFGQMRWAGDDSVGSSLPSLNTLIRDEYGLELKSGTSPVPVLVIDHAEKPTVN